MIEPVSQPGTEPTIRWWCADCAAVCSTPTEDDEACADCGSDLIEQLLIRTPEGLCRWLSVVVGSPGAKPQEVAEHLLNELGESEARLGRLEAWIREQALAAGLPLVVTTDAERVVHLSPGDLVLALGEAAARGREPFTLTFTGPLTLNLREPRSPAGPVELEGEARHVDLNGTALVTTFISRPADPTADTLCDLQAEVDRLSAEVEAHQAAARRAAGLLQRATAALRALDAEVQAGSWRGAEQHLGAPLSDQTLRGLADHLEGELRRGRR